MQTAAHAFSYPAALQTLASPISRTSNTECQKIRFAGPIFAAKVESRFGGHQNASDSGDLRDLYTWTKRSFKP